MRPCPTQVIPLPKPGKRMNEYMSDRGVIMKVGGPAKTRKNQ